MNTHLIVNYLKNYYRKEKINKNNINYFFPKNTKKNINNSNKNNKISHNAISYTNFIKNNNVYYQNKNKLNFIKKNSLNISYNNNYKNLINGNEIMYFSPKEKNNNNNNDSLINFNENYKNLIKSRENLFVFSEKLNNMNNNYHTPKRLNEMFIDGTIKNKKINQKILSEKIKKKSDEFTPFNKYKKLLNDSKSERSLTKLYQNQIKWKNNIIKSNFKKKFENDLEQIDDYTFRPQIHENLDRLNFSNPEIYHINNFDYIINMRSFSHKKLINNNIKTKRYKTPNCRLFIKDNNNNNYINKNISKNLSFINLLN